MTNYMKLHMRFRLVPRAMTLDDLAIPDKLEFVKNLAGFHRFGRQQQLNE